MQGSRRSVLIETQSHKINQLKQLGQ